MSVVLGLLIFILGLLGLVIGLSLIIGRLGYGRRCQKRRRGAECEDRRLQVEISVCVTAQRLSHVQGSKGNYAGSLNEAAIASMQPSRGSSPRFRRRQQTGGSRPSTSADVPGAVAAVPILDVILFRVAWPSLPADL
jgi:hypothetical protein